MNQQRLLELKQQCLPQGQEWLLPQGNALPLLLDSPHSGNQFPDDFQTEASRAELMTGWDAFLDDLWAGATEQGACLLHAHFPRTYIDLNRAPDDINPAMLAESWIAPCQPTDYSQKGMGLIRELALPNIPVYRDKLPIEDVFHRLECYYQPYHQTLAAKLAELAERYGRVWHINCHSTKSVGNAMNIDAGAKRPDIILSDADQTTCDPNFTQLVGQLFADLGYSVTYNYPFKGGYLVRHYGRPEKQQYSLQIEINRALYMDESTFVANDHYAALRQDLTQVSAGIAKYIMDVIA